MSVGNVLATAIRIWIRNLPRFFLLTIVCWLPIVAFYVLLAIDAIGDFVTKHYYEPLMRKHELLRLDTVGAGWIFQALCAAAIALCTVAAVRNQRVGIWRALGAALRRTPSVIGGALVARLATAGVLLAIQIVRYDPRFRLRGTTITDTVVYAAIWIVLQTFVIVLVPIIVAERRGVWAALRRTFALGEHGKVGAIVLVHYVVMSGFHYALFHFMVLEHIGDMSDRWFLIYGYTSFGITTVLSSFSAVLAATLYEKLREAKEGPAPEQLHAVFD